MTDSRHLGTHSSPQRQPRGVWPLPKNTRAVGNESRGPGVNLEGAVKLVTAAIQTATTTSEGPRTAREENERSVGESVHQRGITMRRTFRVDFGMKDIRKTDKRRFTAGRAR